MTLDKLPPELLLNLPHYLHTIEDLYSLASTSRTLYRTCANPNPKIVLRLAANSGRVFFRPHPHFLIAATARQVADWAVEHDDHRYRLELAIQGGVEKLLDLAIDVAGLTMDDIRKLYTFKCDVLNPLNQRLDLSAGHGSGSPGTVCEDTESTLLSWVIYGELFHHSLELAYLPIPNHKPLSSVTRYKWFVYCMPDVNSFEYLEFDGQPAFFKEFQDDKDRFQQLSMQVAMRQMLGPSSWEVKLQSTPAYKEIRKLGLHDAFISSAMHMGLKSLELLVPGGPERLQEDLNQIANGISAFLIEGEEEKILESINDPWLWTAYMTVQYDLSFTLWCTWNEEEDCNPLMKAIRSAPDKVMVE
ncbi:hypothetical protein B0H11DRAFT_1979241 [Mycena galericulata]|nr:hypothetical protein B0H11DRAFT_1979241 [Mycena galericulata]